MIVPMSVRKLFRHCCFLIGLSLLWTSPALQAHEFWIEAEDFTLSASDSLRADLKVGQNLSGNTYAFLPERFERFDLIQGERRSPVNSAQGALPAVNETDLDDGLAILDYRSTPRSLRYNSAGKFERFLRSEGIAWVLERHQSRGLPEKGFTEAYSRFAKALVKVGSGKGEDKALGLELELVLLTNPYVEQDNALSVKLLAAGEPLAQSRITVFFKPFESSAEVLEPMRYTTDAQGIVTLARPEQPGMMLLNAVHMVVPDAKTILKTGAVWESLWASTTFAIE